MDKKNIATTFILIICALVFTVVGTSFMNYLYKNNKIMIVNPPIYAQSGILVYDAKDENKTAIQELVFSDSELGLKPVTGDQDAETQIPSTVTNKRGSEGLYATIKVTAPAGLKILVNNIIIESKEDTEEIKKERKNIFVGIMDKEDGAKSLENDQIELASEPLQIEDKEYTILFWLDAKASQILKGAKISFELHFRIN